MKRPGICSSPVLISWDKKAKVVHLSSRIKGMQLRSQDIHNTTKINKNEKEKEKESDPNKEMLQII